MGGSRVFLVQPVMDFGSFPISRIIARSLVLELVISELQSVMKTEKLGGDHGKWMNKGILHGSYVFNHDILPVAHKTPGVYMKPGDDSLPAQMGKSLGIPKSPWFFARFSQSFAIQCPLSGSERT